MQGRINLTKPILFQRGGAYMDGTSNPNYVGEANVPLESY